MITFTLYENVDINAEPNSEYVKEFKNDDLVERINNLKTELPTYERLSPSPLSLIEKLGRLQMEINQDTEKATLYLINSVLINFLVYRDLLRHGGMDNNFQVRYESDLDKLEELFNRLN